MIPQKKYYDQMTDYPYRVFCEDGSETDSGGLAPHSIISLKKPCEGTLSVELQGAFTVQAPATWHVKLTEERILKSPLALMSLLPRVLETGQRAAFLLDYTLAKAPAGMQRCVTLSLSTADKRLIQDNTVCQ